MSRIFVALFSMLALASISLADVSMTYPQEITLRDEGSVIAGYVSPGQTFDLVFSDNSGYDFEWDGISAIRSSLSPGWEVVSTQRTDTSLVARIKVPAGAASGPYNLRFSFSSSADQGAVEVIEARVIVKKNLLDVSFVRKSSDEFYFVGGKVLYSVTLSNSSIAPASVKISSSLPGNWFEEKRLVLKPGTVEDIELVVTPQTSGANPFTFRAYSGEDGIIIQSFSSELDVRPTLKGKFGSSLSGFPFFTFSLLPFQLFNSLFSLVLP